MRLSGVLTSEYILMRLTTGYDVRASAVVGRDMSRSVSMLQMISILWWMQRTAVVRASITAVIDELCKLSRGDDTSPVF
jgi:hypothetical protein